MRTLVKRLASERTGSHRQARWRAFAVVLFAVLVLGHGANAFCGAARAEGDFGESLIGKLLVASENMRDPRFDQTLIYLIEHGKNGAMGLVVNVPVAAVPVAALLSRLGIDNNDAPGDIGVYYGGPVEPGRAFLLHSCDVLPEGSVAIDDKIAVSSRPEALYTISRGEGPQRSLLALGYAGWAPGQLESELARRAWFVIPSELSLIFASDPGQSWLRAVRRRSLEL